MPNCWQQKNVALGFPNSVCSGTTQTQPTRSSPQKHHCSVKWVRFGTQFPSPFKDECLPELPRFWGGCQTSLAQKHHRIIRHCSSSPEMLFISALSLMGSWIGASLLTPGFARWHWWPAKGEGHQRQGKSHLCPGADARRAKVSLTCDPLKCPLAWSTLNWL